MLSCGLYRHCTHMYISIHRHTDTQIIKNKCEGSDYMYIHRINNINKYIKIIYINTYDMCIYWLFEL